MKDFRTIYVYLEEEGTDAWRPVEAEDLGNSMFKIVSVNENPDDEHWRFKTGDIVRCEPRKLSGGTCIVAVEKQDERTTDQPPGDGRK
jgi:hypothetical protein